jgi:sodium transport system permease protein
MVEQIWIILRKEIVDNFRDWRSVTNALFAVLINPILYIALFGFLGRSFSEQAERPLELPVAGAEHAPGLIDYLEQNNVTIRSAPADPAAAVRAGDVDVVLIVPEDYAEKFSNGRPAPVELIVDESAQSTAVAVERTADLLGRFNSQIVVQRLLVRGINPQLLIPVQVERVNVAAQTSGIASAVLNLLPVVMLTAAFYGGFYLVVDMTAGERERKSLEPLLLNPVPRWRVVMGKYLTALAFTILATTLATAIFLVLLAIPQVQQFTQIRFELDLSLLVTAVLLMIPVVFMAVALEMAVASFTRSVKEASTYTQFIALAGFMPSIFLSVLPIQPQTWMYFIPTVAQLFLIKDLSRGEPLDVTHVIIATVITLAVGAVALTLAIRLFNQERIILGQASS